MMKLYRNEKERKLGIGFFSTVLTVYVLGQILTGVYFYFF